MKKKKYVSETEVVKALDDAKKIALSLSKNQVGAFYVIARQFIANIEDAIEK